MKCFAKRNLLFWICRWLDVKGDTVSSATVPNASSSGVDDGDSRQLNRAVPSDSWTSRWPDAKGDTAASATAPNTSSSGVDDSDSHGLNRVVPSDGDNVAAYNWLSLIIMIITVVAVLLLAYYFRAQMGG